MIIQIQLTALMFLVTSLAIIFLTPTEEMSEVFKAITVAVLLVSLAVVFVASLLRIWL